MIDFPPNGKPGSTPARYEPLRSTQAITTPLEPTSNPLLVLVAWMVVAVPLAWGVTQTVKTSMALFQQAPEHVHAVK